MHLVQVSGSALIGNEGSPELRAPMCRGGSFSQTLSQLIPLSGLIPTISPCVVESAVSQLAVSTGYRGLRVHVSRLRPNQTLFSHTKARSAKLSWLSSKSLKLPPQDTDLRTSNKIHFHTWSTSIVLLSRLRTVKKARYFKMDLVQIHTVQSRTLLYDSKFFLFLVYMTSNLILSKFS